MKPLPYEFKDAALLEQALTHASTGEAADNERLEFLGDAALDLIVAEELYQQDSELDEGALTELKALIVSRKSLARAARIYDLGARARIGRGLDSDSLSRAVLANLYEGVLGAVYLDGGLEASRSFVLETLKEQWPDPKSSRRMQVPKQTLQIYAQRLTGEPPNYELVETRGKAHARAFLVRAEVHGEAYPSAWGRTLKEAEHWAAYEALLVIGEASQDS